MYIVLKNNYGFEISDINLNCQKAFVPLVVM